MKKDLDTYILTRQELLIMKVVWERGSATVRDVCDFISQKKPTAYTTILTLMQILEKKGALLRKRIGRSYLYSPIFSRRQATRNQVNDLLVRFFDGNPSKLIETVLENEFSAPRPIGNTVSVEESNYKNR
jgi:BlaI family transcriptional regulator, penicillinase repressor